MTRGAELLFAWRSEAGVSQLEAAERIEIGRSTLADYEYGRKLPGVAIALRIATVTGDAVPVTAWGEEAAE